MIDLGCASANEEESIVWTAKYDSICNLSFFGTDYEYICASTYNEEFCLYESSSGVSYLLRYLLITPAIYATF